MVFKLNRFKLYYPLLNGNIINYVEKTKYLGYMCTNDKQNDVEMLRQLLYCMIKHNNTHVSFLYNRCQVRAF